MNEMQKSLVLISKKLGIRFLASYPIKLSDNRILVAEGLFPDFGSTKGTLIFQFNVGSVARRDYSLQGYTASTFSISSSEDLDSESFMETLIEWGWMGEESKKPLWINKVN